jgi:hypothetical protein
VLSQSCPSRSTPSAPRAPIRFLPQPGGFKTFVSKLNRCTNLPVCLILSWTTYIGLVVSCVRENVVGLPVFPDQRHSVRWKCFKCLLLRGGTGDDHFEARGDQKRAWRGCRGAEGSKRRAQDQSERGV